MSDGDWSSDVCSSDLTVQRALGPRPSMQRGLEEPSIRVAARFVSKQATRSPEPPLLDLSLAAEGTREARGPCPRGPSPPCSRRPLHRRARDVRSTGVLATSAPP